MDVVILILGFIVAAGIVYVGSLQRQMIEKQEEQIAAQRDLIKELQGVLDKISAS
jgi:hypothetical protein